MESLNLPSILTPDFGLLFWMLVAFVALFLLLAKFGFPAITNAVEARAAIAFDGAAIHRGLIVSGDQFINHPDKIARIRAHFPDALAVEMEAAAIAQTCYQFARPCVIIRALSDLADGEAEYSFETFLQMAATHSAEMVENLVKAL